MSSPSFRLIQQLCGTGVNRTRKALESGKSECAYTNLARQEPNATAIGLLFHSNEQHWANLESKELDPINIAPESAVIHPLDPLCVQHRVLARRQAHIFTCNVRIKKTQSPLENKEQGTVNESASSQLYTLLQKTIAQS